jgi:hypothetical protein
MGMCTIPFLQTVVLLPWILLVGVDVSHWCNNLLMMTVLLLMELRLAPLGRPTLMGPIDSLFSTVLASV